MRILAFPIRLPGKLRKIAENSFLQGGKYTTHELKLFEEHKIPIIAVRGGGGACGGQIPWDDGYVFQAIPDDPILSSEDPEESPEKMAEAVVQKLK